MSATAGHGKSCGNSPSLEETALHTAVLETICSLVHGQREEMAAALQDTLIHGISGEKEEASPIVIENKIEELEIEFDRLLVRAVDENDIIDHKLKQISETILKLKQKKKRIKYTAERSEVIESKTKEVMGLISTEVLDLTEYSDALVYRIIEAVGVIKDSSAALLKLPASATLINVSSYGLYITFRLPYWGVLSFLRKSVGLFAVWGIIQDRPNFCIPSIRLPSHSF